MLLRRLIKIADCRLPFADQVARLRRQRQWLIDLEHLLDPSKQPDQVPLTSQSVAQAIDHYLTALLAKVATDTDEENQRVAAHINETFRNRWWGLFTCYDVEDLPRTNNDLERYMRRIKTGHRRITGRKNVHDFIIRYGRYAACVDYRESVDDLLVRLRQVSHEDFLRERRALDTALLREQKRHRFRHHQPAYLHGLEERWIAAVGKVQS
ncbi:MAG: transposase [Anaerolineae bacterium]|nr:transposase [Anaerolineae bacterium]